MGFSFTQKNPSRQNILFAIQTSGFGGLEVVVLDWLKGIDYSTASVVLVYADGIIVDKLRELDLPVKCIKWEKPSRKSFWKDFTWWSALLTSVRPDRVVLFDGSVGDFDLGVIFACWCRNHRGIFIFESLAPRPLDRVQSRLHFGFLPGLGLYRYKYICSIRVRSMLAHRILVMSRGVRDKIVAYFNYFGDKFSVLYHGVDVQRFRPAPDRRASYRHINGIPCHATVIVSHGRLAHVKRVDRILKAFDCIAEENSDVWLILTGYGPLTEDIEASVQGSNWRDRIKVLGFQGDTSLLLQACDIYVLASENEGFGIALVEAMATGLICVATNVCGPDEIVINGENGFLVEPSDQGILDGLRNVLQLSEDERYRIRQFARATASEKFELGTAIKNALKEIDIPSIFPEQANAAQGAVRERWSRHQVTG